MNQILVTKKLYITPELKRKKKIYKFNFFLSAFLMCALISVAIYAEYDRNKSEEVSQSILNNFNQELQQKDTVSAKNDVLIVVLNNANQNINNEQTIQEQPAKTISKTKVQKTKGGYKYRTIASINIPKINVNYPILDGETQTEEETEALLKNAPTKFWGVDPNTVGNFSIVGHNYRDTRFFSKVPTLEKGDIIEITDETKKTVKYAVYSKYEVTPEDTSCLDEETYGTREVTLITCTNDSKMRVIVKAKEI